MSKPGPKPLPANVHMLRGNPSKLPTQKLRDQLPVDIKLPAPSEWMSEEAIAEWNRIGPELVRLGLISDLDRGPFAIYCEEWADYVHARKMIRELKESGYVETTPSGYRQISVWKQIANRAADVVVRISALFAMNPSDRSGFSGVQAQLTLFPNEHESGSADRKPVAPEEDRAARHFS